MREKNNPLMMITQGFFRSFFIIVGLFLTGFASYKLTNLYYQLEGPPKFLKGRQLINEVISDGTVDDISKNLIISSDEDTGEIRQIVLEIVNTNTNNIDYITIPANTQITLENHMYQRLYAANPEMPQIINLSQLYKYIDKDYIYDFGMIILEDYLDIDISYYTGMEEEYFNTIFKMVGDRFVFTEQWRNTFSQVNDEEDIKALLKEIYREVASNLSLKKKEQYISTYTNVNSDFIHFCHIYGEEKTKHYMIDTKATSDMINEIINNDVTYTNDSQDITDKIENGVTSKGYNIKILNGSKITGLAAHYKDKLTLEGYSVTSVGNYSGDTINTTKIIVSSEELGQDLVTYFTDPIITEGQLEDGTDIEVILGTSDDVK